MTSIGRNQIVSQNITKKELKSDVDVLAGPNKSAAVQSQGVDELRLQLKKEQSKNGLFERFYDFSKNKTGIGIGSDKIGKSIDAYGSGEISKDDVDKQLSDYRKSKENAEQNFGDFAAAGATIPAYFLISNSIKNTQAKIKSNALGIFLKPFKLQSSNAFAKFEKNLSTNKKFAIILPALMAVGGLAKYATLKLNRIGSKEYEYQNNPELSKAENKKAKKKLNWARHKQNFKNLATGAVDGLLAPVTAIAGGVVGVPAYLLATFGLRTAASKNDGNKNTFDGIADNLKNNALLTSLFVGTVGLLSFKKAKFSKVLTENLDKVVQKLTKAPLTMPELPSISVYDELEDVLLNSKPIQSILEDLALPVDKRINKLIDENLFAAKFIQISGGRSELATKLIEDCPPSRTMIEAQKTINQLLGSEKYQVSKLLGVGTVAETYLAKDNSGREVCVKILKKGVDGLKVQKDKDTFIKLIMGSKTRETLTSEQKYLVDNIENMGEGLLKEVDLVNEMESAKKLAGFTKVANVVKPVEAKPGVYVMEKASGISLETLVKYYQVKQQIKFVELAKKNGAMSVDDASRAISEYNQKIAKIRSKSPDFGEIDLSEKEIKSLLHKYQDVLVEQFVKLESSGKTMHGDIHPGNIFIDLNVLKSGNGKAYTLIDTGNTIDLSKEQAQRVIKLTSLVKNGNVKDMSKYVLEGAIIPENMTKEGAEELVEKRLKKLFYGSTEKIEGMNVEEFERLSDAVLRENNIISANTQLSLKKARRSAKTSMNKLIESFVIDEFVKLGSNVNKNDGKAKTAAKAAKTGASLVGSAILRDKIVRQIQEVKNLSKMSPREVWNTLRNPNMLKTNSVEYLTYKFKQDIPLGDGLDSLFA